jgi:hypothetical protein
MFLCLIPKTHVAAAARVRNIQAGPNQTASTDHRQSEAMMMAESLGSIWDMKCKPPPSAYVLYTCPFIITRYSMFDAPATTRLRKHPDIVSGHRTFLYYYEHT